MIMLVAIASACTPRVPPATGVVVALESEPQSLDPRFAMDAAASRVADLIHLGLTRPREDGRRTPALANGWTYDDPQRVRFCLRRGFRFSDGTPVTAADVRATYEAVLDPATGSPRRGALAEVERIESPDAFTVIFHLRRPFPPFLDATGLGIVPARLAMGRGEIRVGAGPFRVERVDPGQRIVLRPNPGWPGPPPRLDPLVLRIVPDPLVRALELKRGGISLAQDPPEPELLEWLARDARLQVRRRPGSSFAYLALNLRNPRLARPAVRRALAMALDREALLATVLGGAGRPATGLLAPEHWAYASARLPRHDPQRAARLLDRTGLRDPDGAGPRARFRLVYKTSSLPVRRRLAEAIQAQLAAVGIAVDVRTQEWATLYAEVRAGRFEIAPMTWVGVTEPDLYFLALHSTMTPPAGYNRGAYASPVMDRLTERARYEPRAVRRRQLYARIQRRAARDLPVLPLWWEDRIVVHTARLRGFEPTASGDLHALARAWLAP